MQASKPDKSGAHVSTLQTLVSMYRGEGIWGFYRGIRAKILQSILAGALMFMIKEKLFEVTAAALNNLNVVPPVPTDTLVIVGDELEKD